MNDRTTTTRRAVLAGTAALPALALPALAVRAIAAQPAAAPTWRTAQTYIAFLDQEARVARYLFAPPRSGITVNTPADEPVRRALADPHVMLARMLPVMRAAMIDVDQIDDPRIWDGFYHDVLDAAFRAGAAKGGAA